MKTIFQSQDWRLVLLQLPWFNIELKRSIITIFKPLNLTLEPHFINLRHWRDKLQHWNFQETMLALVLGKNLIVNAGAGLR